MLWSQHKLISNRIKIQLYSQLAWKESLAVNHSLVSTRLHLILRNHPESAYQPPNCKQLSSNTLMIPNYSTSQYNYPSNSYIQDHHLMLMDSLECRGMDQLCLISSTLMLKYVEQMIKHKPKWISMNSRKLECSIIHIIVQSSHSLLINKHILKHSSLSNLKLLLRISQLSRNSMKSYYISTIQRVIVEKQMPSPVECVLYYN